MTNGNLQQTIYLQTARSCLSLQWQLIFQVIPFSANFLALNEDQRLVKVNNLHCKH